ncbi:hypothetical protein JHK85_033232 [Glycine max]|uniref:Uncharacterized protein n=1 Tax=Glycine max TaxID=3847 RepID=K7LSG3_SOYBN|nr:hypothetical protein JHK85_033232 [Glycine max]KAH1141118.1 hypothetical protein GYH30_032400 [Glycine max]
MDTHCLNKHASSDKKGIKHGQNSNQFIVNLKKYIHNNSRCANYPFPLLLVNPGVDLF